MQAFPMVGSSNRGRLYRYPHAGTRCGANTAKGLRSRSGAGWQDAQLLHGQEKDAFGDAGYQGVDKRPEAQGLKVNWHIAMRPGKRAVLDRSRPLARAMDRLEQIKASIRAKVEHPFRVIKQQVGFKSEVQHPRFQ